MPSPDQRRKSTTFQKRSICFHQFCSLQKNDLINVSYISLNVCFTFLTLCTDLCDFLPVSRVRFCLFPTVSRSGESVIVFYFPVIYLEVRGSHLTGDQFKVTLYKKTRKASVGSRHSNHMLHTHSIIH